MSKRKSRKRTKPNLPESTLARARAQARGDDAPPEADEEQAEDAAPVEAVAAEETAAPDAPAEKSDEEAKAAVAEAAGSSRRSRRREGTSSSRSRGSSSRSSRRSTGPATLRQINTANLDNTAMQNLLTNPTKVVTEEELKEEYSHVVTDIRNMFGLAIFLMVLLVILAQFI